MKVLEYIKIAFYLVVAIVIAALGLNHSFYGLMVSFQNPSIYEIYLSNIENEDIQKNRYLNIKDAYSIVDPLIFVNKNGNPVSYIYALTSAVDSNQIEAQIPNSKIIVESEIMINNWENAKVTGLLKPYWSSIDEEIVRNFEFSGIKISNNAEYLKLNTKPWNWYWHVLIILLAMLFFYRMFEALFKKIRETSTEDQK